MIMFDRNKRIEFVTGFKKRKDERRLKAKQMAKEEKRQERSDFRKTKAAQRQNIDEQYEQIRQLKRAEMGLPEEDEKELDQNQSSGEESAAGSDGEGGMFEKE